VRRITLLLISMALMVGVASSVALAVTKDCQANTDCFGTNQADTLTGSSGEDHIFGLGGSDLIRGLGSGDELSGGSGGDEVSGGAGGDDIFGAGGADELRGGDATDDIFAGNGDDTVIGGAGADSLRVNGDQDAGFQDEVFCSGPEDIVEADPNDILHNCLLS
jgi:Ca2+-binding RTX toxin-like protein